MANVIRWKVGVTEFTYEPSVSRGWKMSLFRRRYHEEIFSWVGFYPTLEAAQKAAQYRE